MASTSNLTGVFAPKPSRIESKADATTNAARSILDAEAKAQANKTARLRALRMAREAAEPKPEPAPKRTAAKKASTAAAPKKKAAPRKAAAR